MDFNVIAMCSLSMIGDKVQYPFSFYFFSTPSSGFETPLNFFLRYMDLELKE